MSEHKTRFVHLLNDNPFRVEVHDANVVVSGVKFLDFEGHQRLGGEVLCSEMSLPMLTFHLTQIIRNFCIMQKTSSDVVLDALGKIVNSNMDYVQHGIEEMPEKGE